jgi:hypothetical protein
MLTRPRSLTTLHFKFARKGEFVTKVWRQVVAALQRINDESGRSGMNVPNKLSSKFMKASGIALVASLSVLASSGAAFAAGNGYGPGSPPPSAIAGGFTKIITTKTLHKSGGKIQGSANGASAVVLVPAGSLRNGGQIVLSDGPLKNIKVGKNLKVVADFSVVVLNPNTGARLLGTWKPAVTVIIHDSSIRVGDKIVVVVKPGHVTTISRAVISTGMATVTFTSDPNFAVVAPK